MPERDGRVLSTDRIESFSDAVLAIILTLLVLDLLPDRAEAPVQYLRDWPEYLAYLIAFLTIGSIWINHHAVFSRIERADGAVFVLNLLILLGASLVPWPTAAIALALGEDDRAKQVAAIALYAIVTALICIPWILLDRHVLHRDGLLAGDGDAAWLRRHALLAALTVLVALVAVAVALVAPLVALAVYLAVVVVFVGARVRETRG